MATEFVGNPPTVNFTDTICTNFMIQYKAFGDLKEKQADEQSAFDMTANETVMKEKLEDGLTAIIKKISESGRLGTPTGQAMWKTTGLGLILCHDFAHRKFSLNQKLYALNNDNKKLEDDEQIQEFYKQTLHQLLVASSKDKKTQEQKEWYESDYLSMNCLISVA